MGHSIESEQIVDSARQFRRLQQLIDHRALLLDGDGDHNKSVALTDGIPMVVVGPSPNDILRMT